MEVFADLLRTIASLVLLLLILAALRKLLVFYSIKFGITGLATFLS